MLHDTKTPLAAIHTKKITTNNLAHVAWLDVRDILYKKSTMYTRRGMYKSHTVNII